MASVLSAFADVMSTLEAIPNRPYSLAMGASAVVAVALAALMGSSMGLTGPVLMGVMGVAAVMGAMFVAMLIGPTLITPENWGLAIMAVSGARTMLALGAMLVMVESMGLPRAPVVYSIMVPAALLMTVEACVAVMLLMARERARIRSSSPVHTTESSAPGQQTRSADGSIR